MSERLGEADSGTPARLLWLVVGPFEFVFSITVGVLLLLLQAALIYFDALRGLFGRSVVLLAWRFRVGPVSSSAGEGKISPPFSEVDLRRDPMRRRQDGPWLN